MAKTKKNPSITLYSYVRGGSHRVKRKKKKLRKRYCSYARDIFSCKKRRRENGFGKKKNTRACPFRKSQLRVLRYHYNVNKRARRNSLITFTRGIKSVNGSSSTSILFTPSSSRRNLFLIFSFSLSRVHIMRQTVERNKKKKKSH